MNTNVASTHRAPGRKQGGPAGCEPLEHRLLFDAVGSTQATAAATQAELVPVIAPMVLRAEFDDERAPHELRVSFSKDVWASLDGHDLLLVNDPTRYVFPSERITVNWDFETNTAHFVFVRADDGALPEGKWHATLLADGITDENGIPLDGDGDELPGGDYRFSFSFLRGDANRDGAVDLDDFNVLAANFGQRDRTFSQGDFNYDGLVNLKDFNILAARFGQGVARTEGAAAFDASRQWLLAADADQQRVQIEELA